MIKMCCYKDNFIPQFRIGAPQNTCNISFVNASAPGGEGVLPDEFTSRIQWFETCCLEF